MYKSASNKSEKVTNKSELFSSKWRIPHVQNYHMKNYVNEYLFLFPYVAIAGYCTNAVAGESKKQNPNIVIIMADDMGYSDIGCYGSEIQTPNIDQLASDGLRFNTFYNNAKSCPTRASLLTGLYNHEAGMGNMVTSVDQKIIPGPYQGFLNENSVTIAEVLKNAGYTTYMSGKWHVGERKEHWPLQRGFDKYFGLISGASSYFEIIKEQPRMRMMAYDNESWTPPADEFYMTRAISDSAVSFIRHHSREEKNTPFFLYVAYTAPHWPLHALDEDIEKYANKYDIGWDSIRQKRYNRMLKLGIITRTHRLSPRSPNIPDWQLTEEKELWARRMQVYAAMIDCMDQGVGSIMNALKQFGDPENTLVIFLADNGGCAEDVSTRNLAIPDIPVGEKGSYDAYREPWANVSNTPFRFYKNWLYEGGIRTPCIVHWPAVIKNTGKITTSIGHITDIMATCIDVAGTEYPDNYKGHPVKPLRGESLLPVFKGRTNNRKAPIYWEYAGQKAMREGKWKILQSEGKPWELYDLENDPTELHDLSPSQPDILDRMIQSYTFWATGVSIKSFSLLYEGSTDKNKKSVENFK